MLGSTICTLQSAATANGNGLAVDTAQFDQVLNVEIAETRGGTGTITLQGSYDGTNWYAVGYQRIDGQATLTRAVAGINVTGNSRHVYQVLDPYPQLQAVLSSVSSATVTVKVFAF